MEKFEHVYCPKSGVHEFKFVKTINDIDYHQCTKCGIFLGSDLFYRDKLDDIKEDKIVNFIQR